MQKQVTCAVAAIFLCILAAAQVSHRKSDAPSPILWTYSGQVLNAPSTPPTSHQFGTLAGIAAASSGEVITFDTEATTTSVRQNGPLRILERTGTTRIFAATGPSPDAPKYLLVVATLYQVVIVDTTSGTFSATNFNTVEESNPLRTSRTTVASVGQTIRSTLTGHMNAPNETPSGWFGGLAELVR